jgi:two-component system cell cycle response regulator
MLRRRPGPFQLCLAVLAVGVVVHVAHVIVGVSFGPLNDFITRWLYTGIEGLATALLWARVAVLRRDRLAWSLFAVYATLWTIGDLGWTLDYDLVDDPPFPNWTDAVYIASYLFAYGGLVQLLRDRIRPFRLSLWLDGLIGGLALGALCTAAFLGPVLGAASHEAGRAVTLTYPVLDVLLLCIVGIAFGVSHWRPGRVWTFLGLALALSAVGDASYSWLDATGRYSDASWVNGTWPAAMAALSYAATCRAARRAAYGAHDAPFAAPAAFAATALGLLVWSQFHAVPLLAALLAAGALLVGGARAWLTHLENVALLRRSRAEAMTDGLTGLGNRRRLMLDLDTTLSDAQGDCPSTLVFFDLDGFKGYNDVFGHAAGDALLMRLAGALDAAVRGEGAAYRLGGDEFCVLLDHDAARDTAAVLRAAVSLTEEGEGFAISSSYGLVRLPAEADTASVALQLADERMYDDKGSRRGSTRRQTRDLLLQVLREREPQLEEHVDDVGALAVAVGRELRLGAEALDELARGAELHDIGKVAVPEAILGKTGPLDEAEWQVMRQHTIVGERILAAAPALRPVAKLVRSSHERWDGSGYPDGLAGEAIPLGSRIIAVCDAFDAMRQARPYAASMSEAAALAELRRCAGTQFDPRVVEAFAALLARGAGRALRVA